MTIIILIITSLVSIICFSNQNLFGKLVFNPYRVYHNREYYRLFTHALLHADWIHLIVNMFVLYQFGQVLEAYFYSYSNIFHIPYTLVFLIMYISSIYVSSLTTLKKYRDAIFYNAVGASGAVSTVLFACIFFDPWSKIGLYLIIPVPGIIFGVLYLWYCSYMSKRSNDNINHDAHFLGALYGLTFPILMNPKLFYDVFIEKLIHFHF